MADYSGESTNFLSKTFEVLDTALNTFAQDFSAKIATEIAPLVAGGLTLTFIMMGLMAVYGMLDRPFKELAWRMLWASVIMSMALTSAMYQTYVVDVLMTLPDDLVTSIVSTSISEDVATGQNASKAIEALFSKGAYNAGLFFNEASMNPIDANLAPYLYGGLVLLGTLLCCAMGALWLLIAKVILALMVGLGPIFIVCLIWRPTQQFFWSWVGQIINTVITAIFVLAVFSIFASIFDAGLASLTVEENDQQLVNSAVYTFLGVLCMGVLISIPQYVAQLVGVAGGAVGSAMGRISGGAVGGAKGATGGVAGTARAGLATKSAVSKYRGNRDEGSSRLASARDARHEFNKSRQEMKQGYPDYYRQQSSNRRNPEKK